MFRERKIQIRRAIIFGSRLEQALNYARADTVDLILLASHVLQEI